MELVLERHRASAKVMDVSELESVPPDECHLLAFCAVASSGALLQDGWRFSWDPRFGEFIKKREGDDRVLAQWRWPIPRNNHEEVV